MSGGPCGQVIRDYENKGVRHEQHQWPPYFLNLGVLRDIVPAFTRPEYLMQRDPDQLHREHYDCHGDDLSTMDV